MAARSSVYSSAACVLYSEQVLRKFREIHTVIEISLSWARSVYLVSDSCVECNTLARKLVEHAAVVGHSIRHSIWLQVGRNSTVCGSIFVDLRILLYGSRC